MSLQLGNRVKETSLTSGSGVITLNGAVDSYQAFSSVLSSGDTTYYTILNNSDWEVGIGTYSSNSLSRDTILSSSNSGNRIDLIRQSDVFIAYPSEKSVYRDANDQIVAGSSGILFNSGIPSNVDNVLYLDDSLYFDGTKIIQSGDNISLLVNNSGYLTDIVQDISPQLGDDLDLNSNSITGVGSIEIDGTISGVNGVFNSGVQLFDTIPSDTTNVLYNNSGILYFDNVTIGSIKKYENISSDTTLDISADIVFVDSSSSAININMPQASGNGGKEIKIKRAFGNNLTTINASGLGNIDGQTNFTMHHLYQSVTLVSNNLNWFIT